MNPQPHLFRSYYLPIVFVLFIAAALRFSGVASTPVWTDEGWSTWAMSEPTVGAIVDKLVQDRHPPLYFLAVGLWSNIAGESRIALRLPSVLVGVLTVALVFRIGEDTFGRTARPGREDVAWYGMLVFALLPVAVYYSQEIRHFGWFVCAACVSSLVFVRLLRDPTPRRLVLYALSVALMMYLLYFGVWVVLVQVFVGLVLWRGDARRNWRTSPRDKGKLVLAWVGAFVLYLPWFYVVMTRQLPILTAGITAAPGTFDSNLPGIHQLLALLMGGGFALTGGLYIVGLWGTLVSDRTDVTLGLRFSNPAWLGTLYVVLWGLGLFVLLALVNLRTGVLSTRTTVFLSPALMLVVGAGIVRLRTGVRWSLLAGYIATSLFLVPLIQPRLAYDATAARVATGYSPGDLIVLETVWDDNAFRYELRRAVGEDAQIIRTLPWVNNRDPYQPVVPQIRDEIDDTRRIWVVQWNSAPEVLPYLDSAESGFERMLELTAPVGEQYEGRFADVGAADNVQIVLFGEVDLAANAITARYGDTLAVVDIITTLEVTAGAPLHIDLFWQALQPLELDYSVGVYLIDADGTIVAQQDGPPSGVPPTSAWEVGTVYPARQTVNVPPDLPPGDYALEVAVYFFQTPDEPLLSGGRPSLSLGSVQVNAR